MNPLDEELSDPKYTGSDGALLLAVLNSPTLISNPEPRQMVPRLAIPQPVLLVTSSNLQNRRLKMLMNPQAPSLPEALRYAVDTLIPTVAKQDSLDISKAEYLVDTQMILGGLQQAGLLSAEEVFNLLNEPDPNWVEILETPSVAENILGRLATLEDLPEERRGETPTPEPPQPDPIEEGGNA